MSQQKVRVPNFTSAEKLHLLTLIADKYSKILEDKKTDRVSALQKEKAWSEIENDFNSSSVTSIYRNAACLKKCYENRKKELRKTVAREKQEALLTGGGPPPKKKKDNDDSLMDEILMSILNEKTIVGLHNPFDDDAIDDEIAPFSENNNNSFELVLESDSQTEDVTDLNIWDHRQMQASTYSSGIDWRKSTGKQLQNPINPALALRERKTQMNTSDQENLETARKEKIPITAKKNSNRRRPTTVIKTLTSSNLSKKYDILLDRRLTVIEGQIEHMRTENALILEKRQLEIALLKEELNQKKKKVI